MCSATSRLIVHEDIKDRILDAIVKVANHVKMGSGLAEGTKLGPLVSDGQHRKVIAYIDNAVKEGMASPSYEGETKGCRC